MEKSIYPTQAISEILASIDATELLRLINYRVDKIESTRPFEYRCFCPIHKENIFRTLLVEDHDKKYQCSYNFCPGSKGGDFIDLFAKVNQVPYDEAVRQLARRFAPHVALADASAGGLNKMLEVARNYLELNALDEAINAYHHVLQADPFAVEAHEGLAQCWALKGDAEQAKAELSWLLELHNSREEHDQVARLASRLVEIDPEEPDYYNILVNALLHLGDTTNARLYQARFAELLEAAGRTAEAVDAYLAIEQSGVVDPEIALRTINSLLAARRFDEARERATMRFAELRQMGDSAHARALLMMMVGWGAADADQLQELAGEVHRQGVTAEEIEQILYGADRYAEHGQPDEALQLVDMLGQRAKGNMRVMEARSRLLSSLGDADGALRHDLEIVDRLLHDNQLDDARAWLDQILAQDPNNSEALKLMVEWHERRGDEESAMQLCWRIIDLLKATGDWPSTLPIYEKLTSFEPDNGALRQEFIGALADSGRQREAGLAAVMFAEELVGQGRDEEALERLESFRSSLPSNAEIRVKLADMLAERHNEPAAAEVLAEAAAIAQQAGNARQAQAHLTNAARLDAENLEIQRGLAEVQRANGETAAAAETLKALADTLLRRGETDAAHDVMARVFELSPEDTGSLRTMARILGNRHDEGGQVSMMLRLGEVCLRDLAYQRVLSVAADILRIDPVNIRAQELRIEALRLTQQTAQAVAAIKNLAEQHLASGDAGPAESLLREILKMDATNLAVREDLAMLMLRQKRWDEAAVEGLVVVEANRRLRRLDQARRIVDALLQAIPRSVPLRESALGLEREAGNPAAADAHAATLLQIFRETDNSKGLIALCRQLLANSPENVSFRETLTNALREKGETQEAALHGLRLARDLRVAGRPNDAIKWFETVVALEPSNEAAQLERAAILNELGDMAGASEAYADLADQFRQEGKDAEALAVVERGLATDKRNVRLRRLAIDIHLDSQQIEAAVAAYLALYEVYRVSEERKRSLEIINEAIGVKPDSVALRRAHIEELREVGRDSEAADAEASLVRLHLKLRDKASAEALAAQLRLRVPAPSVMPEVERLLVEGLPAGSGSSPDASGTSSGSNKAISLTTPRERPAQTTGTMQATGDYMRLGPTKQPTQLLAVKSYTFESFVIGSENQFAHATCLAVAREPASQYNPLFVWGQVGLGKTHLVNAIANYYAEHHVDKAVLYTSTDEFVSRLIEAIQANAITAFRNDFRAVDILLIDDIQFLSGKERAQEEFFHVFNVLFQAGKQIVLTSDRPPRNIAHLEDRLVSRFASGVIVDVKPPGIETRMAIVKREIVRRGLDMDDDVLDMVVKRVEGGVRELKGAINQICAMAEIGGDKISSEKAQQLLDTIYATAP